MAAQGLAGAAQMPSPALPHMRGSRGRLAADRLRLAVLWAAAAGVGGTPDAAPAGPATPPPRRSINWREPVGRLKGKRWAVGSFAAEQKSLCLRR